MPTQRAERRLAAILTADVAEYSRLMGADEGGTLRRFKAHRRALGDPKIAQYRGRIVKTTGDGMLVEFASVVDAVRCAVEIQCGMAERNLNVPDDKRIEFRVGINVGDIIIEGGDIFGDGVNVAARLEALAEAGGICVSGRVQEDIVGRLPISFEDRGEQHVKNIARPIRICALGPNAIVELPPPLDSEEDGAAYVRGPPRIGPTATTAMLLVFAVAMLGPWWLIRHSGEATPSHSENGAAAAKSGKEARIGTQAEFSPYEPPELNPSVLLPGEPPFGTLRSGTRYTLQSSACRPGEVLEIVAGSDKIPRRKRCISDNIAAGAKAADEARIAAPTEFAPNNELLPGEPPFGTLRYGTRYTFQSSACRPGQVLEIIAGWPRRRRCISAN